MSSAAPVTRPIDSADAYAITQADWSALEQALLTAKREGMLARLDLNRGANQAYVHPGIWQRMDAQAQQLFCANLAVYCEMAKAAQHGQRVIYQRDLHVVVYDAFSGRPLAQWAPGTGLVTL